MAQYLSEVLPGRLCWRSCCCCSWGRGRTSRLDRWGVCTPEWTGPKTHEQAPGKVRTNVKLMLTLSRSCVRRYEVKRTVNWLMKGAMLKPSVGSVPCTALSCSSVSDSTSMPWITTRSGKMRPPSSRRQLKKKKKNQDAFFPPPSKYQIVQFYGVTKSKQESDSFSALPIQRSFFWSISYAFI